MLSNYRYSGLSPVSYNTTKRQALTKGSGEFGPPRRCPERTRRTPPSPPVARLLSSYHQRWVSDTLIQLDMIVRNSILLFLQIIFRMSYHSLCCQYPYFRRISSYNVRLKGDSNEIVQQLHVYVNLNL